MKLPVGPAFACPASVDVLDVGYCTRIKIFILHLQVVFVALLEAVTADIVNRNNDRRKALRLLSELLRR